MPDIVPTEQDRAAADELLDVEFYISTHEVKGEIIAKAIARARQACREDTAAEGTVPNVYENASNPEEAEAKAIIGAVRAMKG